MFVIVKIRVVGSTFEVVGPFDNYDKAHRALKLHDNALWFSRVAKLTPVIDPDRQEQKP